MLGSKIHSHYKIVKFLGVGKFGETYLAEDEDLPGNPRCIIKRFRYEGTAGITPLTQKLFEVQAEILYKLGEHPRIPELIAKFTDQNDLYLVQEYIEGTELQQLLIPKKTWSIKSVINLLIDILNTLKFFHDRGYIHQDIKPQNLIKRQTDNKYVIIGLGSVKDVKSLWQNLPEKNNVIVTVGSPGYVPFEQEYGNPQFNSDIYALGVIAIQALTGIFPLPKDPHTQVIQWRDYVKINFRLADILDKMVKPDYRNRYQSVDEVLADLKAFAQTQVKQSPWEQIKPHLIFASSILGVILSLGFLINANNKSTNQPPIVPAKMQTNTTPAPSIKEVNDPFKIYSDNSNKFTIKYAPNFQIKKSNNTGDGERVTFLTPLENNQDQIQETITISSGKLNKPTTLEQYTQGQTEAIKKSILDAQVIESSNANLGKYPANLIVYTSKDQRSQTIKTLQIWTIINNQAYLITYRAEPSKYYKYLQEVMMMINSFNTIK